MAPATRSDFVLEPDLVFLNHGSFGATPVPVLEEQRRLQLAMERNPVEWLGRRADHLLADAREVAASFVGARADDLVFFPNPSTAFNMVVRCIPLQPGDEVLTTDHEYGAMQRTWMKRCAETGASWVPVEIPLPVTSADDFIERVWSRVSSRTRVLFLSHLTSATALAFPVAELCRLARERGIVAMVDGAHVPAHLELDLGTLGADVYTGAFHKWLCAPKGSSFLWAQPTLQPTLHPLVVSWGWEAEHPGPSSFIDWHEWQGTRDLSAFLATPAAIEFAEQHDWRSMRERCRQLALQTRRRIDELTGLEPISPSDDTAAHRWIGQMVAVRLPDATDVVQLQRRLYDDHRIEVPCHRWNGLPLMRISVAAHTSEADLDQLVQALRSLL
jgi:isopenicillin-N epimerase